MGFGQLIFGFNGRIRRTHYWLGSLGAGFVLSTVFLILFFVLGGGAMLAVGGMSEDGTVSNGGAAVGIGAMVILGLLFVAFMVLAIWIGLALQIKRWHDRDKSGVWVFITFIPFVGAVWSLIELGFLDGTMGPNRFGPSPKGIAGPMAMPGYAPPMQPAAPPMTPPPVQ